MLASKKSGAGLEDLYVPSVWYFKDLDFLLDHEIQISGTSTMGDEFLTIQSTSENMVRKLC